MSFGMEEEKKTDIILDFVYLQAFLGVTYVVGVWQALLIEISATAPIMLLHGFLSGI